MMMTFLLATTLAAAAQTGIEVQAGRAQWDSFPALQRVPREHPTSAMVDRVTHILQERQCNLAGQSARRFDITVPYLVRVRPDGQAERIIVADIGCPAIETYVGSIVTLLAQAGDFRPTGEAEARWYSSRMNFNLH